MVVAVAHLQVKYPSNSVAVLCGPGSGEEVGVRKEFVVKNGHWPSASAGNAEVVGVRNVDALHAVEHACRSVAAHHKVVALVVGALYARKVGRHPRGFAATARVEVGFFDAELARAHRSHLIFSLARSGGGHADFVEV